MLKEFLSYESIALLMFVTMLLMMFTGQRVFGAIGFVAAASASFLLEKLVLPVFGFICSPILEISLGFPLPTQIK